MTHENHNTTSVNEAQDATVDELNAVDLGSVEELTGSCVEGCCLDGSNDSIYRYKQAS